MHERIELVFSEKKKFAGFSLAVTVSLVLHAFLIVLFLRSYDPVAAVAARPATRYIDFMKQSPDFVEAPGPAVERPPSLAAPLSDANRKATMPEATGERPTARPGNDSGLHRPRIGEPSRSPVPQQQTAPRAEQRAAAQLPTRGEAAESAVTEADLIYRESPKTAAASAAVDWRSAIREVGKVASLTGAEGLDLGNTGGEKGFAEQGPISFETQWFDWGPYAQSMVSRIRVNWYANMPQIIRTGMKGVVTIRFTIHRDGRISDVTIIKSSDVPPYDHAAKKAIELSSPLNPLPKDFPNAFERVTAAFYYNTELPSR